MIIRKQFNFEGAHIVRNCSSIQCRENIHGHSYIVEVFLKSNKLDKGHMVMDFVLLDKVKEFINSFDHSYTLWDGEDQSVKEAIYKLNSRVVEMPMSPSAEGYALIFFHVIDQIIQNMELKNGEGKVSLSSVRVHETRTGYAEAFEEDKNLISFTLEDFHFTEGIIKEWKNPQWWEDLKNSTPFPNKYI